MRTAILFLVTLISCSCAMQPCSHVSFEHRDAKICGDPFAGLNRRGIILISDVDDTIKDTHVMCGATRERNLLRLAVDGLHAWRPVLGMAMLYRHWQNAYHVNFIYLSAGPTRYRRRLEQSREDWDFPRGPVVLRDAINPKPPPDYKWRAIRPIVARLRDRHFVLVGDSGEYDPECYGKLAREYPNQVDHIFIREISNETINCPRYRCAFQGVTGKVTLFPSPETITDRALARDRSP
jgi:phosphatidate phosphatase APP1